MAKLFSQKLLKAIGANKDIAASIKEVHFKLCQKPQKSSTGRAFAMLVNKLKDEEVASLTPEEQELMVRGCGLLNEDVNDERYLTDFLRYMSHERPLLNYTKLNSEARNMVAEMDSSIKSISAQPVKRFIGKVIVTYKTNNEARDRDKSFLNKVLENLTGYTPQIQDEKVEGVRVYLTCNWVPTLASVKNALDESFYDFVDAYNAYKDAGMEMSEYEIMEAFMESLNVNVLNNVDAYSLERIINLIEGTRITLSDVTGKGHLAQFRINGDGTISDKMLVYLEDYLQGISIVKTAGCLTLNVVGDTIAAEAFEQALSSEYVKELIKEL